SLPPRLVGHDRVTPDATRPSPTVAPAAPRQPEATMRAARIRDDPTPGKVDMTRGEDERCVDPRASPRPIPLPPRAMIPTQDRVLVPGAEGAPMNLPTGTGDDLLRVAAVQMNSRDDKAVNIQTALELIDRAAGSGARLVALPEVWTYLGPQDGNRDN